MLTETFWDTFWGGLASLAVFGVVSAITVWIVSRITAPFRKRPDWIIEADHNGNCHLTYVSRRQGWTGSLRYSYRGTYVEASDYEEDEGQYTKLYYIPTGHKIYLPTEFDWDEVSISWIPHPEHHATARAPRPNESQNVTGMNPYKVPWRYRFFRRSPMQ